MKCQSLISCKSKKNAMNLWSEFAQRVKRVNCDITVSKLLASLIMRLIYTFMISKK